MTTSYISWMINLNTFTFELGPVLGAQLENDNEAKMEIAQAVVDEIPIIPNNIESAVKLESLFSDLKLNGFESDTKKYKVKNRFFGEFSSSVEKLIQPAEVTNLMRALDEEKRKSNSAKTLIPKLYAATTELSELLTNTKRNENSLQRCLTKYPVLLGVNYKQIIHKYKLGSEYETDYALELNDGSVDMMEIEASTHPLYNSKGDPSAYLTHAEQQVQDWLAWLESNSAYASKTIPGLLRPKAYVVIGRRSSLNDNTQAKLKMRNKMYDGRITIMTYDDILDTAYNLLHILE